MEAFQKHEISTIASSPFPDQHPVTSFVAQGLERSVKDFKKENYTENFIQSAVNVCKMSKSIIVGGMGDASSNEIILKIVRVAAGNGIEKIYTGGGGIISRPAISHLARKYGAWAFSIHNSCTNLTVDKSRNLSISLLDPTGLPVEPNVLEEVLQATQFIREYKSVTTIQELGLCRHANMLYKVEQNQLVVAVIDTVSDYVKIMDGIFSFDRINHLLNGTSHFRPFRIVIDCDHGAAGPYAKRIFEEELGAGKGSVLNFKTGGTPCIFDRIKVGKMDIDAELRGSTADLGAYLDCDGSRCVVYGRRGFAIPPGLTSAVVLSHYHAIPYFLKHKLSGALTSFLGPSDLIDVAQKAGMKVVETSNNWATLVSMDEANRTLLSEDDNYGICCRPLSVTDGIWTILAWLSIVIHLHKPVRDIVTDHWLIYGRNFFTTYEFHGLQVTAISKMFAELSNVTFKVEDLTTVIRPVGEDQFRILEASQYEHTTLKKDVPTEAPLKVLVEPKGRIVYNQLIYDGQAVLQIFVEINRKDAPVKSNKFAITENLFQLAMTLGKVALVTGKAEPDLTY